MLLPLLANLTITQRKGLTIKQKGVGIKMAEGMYVSDGWDSFLIRNEKLWEEYALRFGWQTIPQIQSYLYIREVARHLASTQNEGGVWFWEWFKNNAGAFGGEHTDIQSDLDPHVVNLVQTVLELRVNPGFGRDWLQSHDKKGTAPTGPRTRPASIVVNKDESGKVCMFEDGVKVEYVEENGSLVRKVLQ